MKKFLIPIILIGTLTACKKETTVGLQSSLNLPELKIAFSKTSKNITVIIPDIDNADYSIFDTNGRTLASGQWNALAPTISVNGINNGIYLIHLKCNEKSFTGKFSIY